MEIEDNDEFFVVIHKIIKILRDNKEFTFADELEEAQSSSTVPGEIFGQIRICLRKLSVETLARLKIARDVHECLDCLDRALDE